MRQPFLNRPNPTYSTGYPRWIILVDTLQHKLPYLIYALACIYFIYRISVLKYAHLKWKSKGFICVDNVLIWPVYSKPLVTSVQQHNVVIGLDKLQCATKIQRNTGFNTCVAQWYSTIYQVIFDHGKHS